MCFHFLTGPTPWWIRPDFPLTSSPSFSSSMARSGGYFLSKDGLFKMLWRHFRLSKSATNLSKVEFYSPTRSVCERLFVMQIWPSGGTTLSTSHRIQNRGYSDPEFISELIQNTSPTPKKPPQNLANQTFFPKFISKLTQNTPPPEIRTLKWGLCVVDLCVETTTVTPEDTVLFKCSGDIFVLIPQR